MADLDNILSELDNALDGLNSQLSYQPPPQQTSYQPPPQQSYQPPQPKPAPPQQSYQIPQPKPAPVQPISQPPVQSNAPISSPPTHDLARQGSARTEQLQKQLEEIRARKEARQSVNAPPATTGISEGEWKQASTATGKVYYYNTKTKQTSWVKPEGFVDSSAPPVTKTEPVKPAPQQPISPPQSIATNSPKTVTPQKSFEIPRPGSIPQGQPIKTNAPVQPAPAQQITRVTSPVPGKPTPNVLNNSANRPFNQTPQIIPQANNPRPVITPNQQIQRPMAPAVGPGGAPASGPGSLQAQPWYFGNISRTETENILKNSRKNGFLVRDSSQPGCYACSMIDFSKMQVHHTLIVKVPSGYHFEEQPEFGEYPDVVSLVKNTTLLQQFTPLSK